MKLRTVAALLLSLLVSAVSPAQTGPLPRTAAIYGLVRDSASGGPIQKSWVCVDIPSKPAVTETHCAHVDSVGAYRLDSLPAVSVGVSLACEAIRGRGKRLGQDRVVLADSSAVRRDWTVASTGCDRRPVRRVTGIFRGHYTPGFESSDFVPCAADGWFIPGDSLDLYSFNARHAWAAWPRGV
jgi:hypothetical protein